MGDIMFRTAAIVAGMGLYVLLSITDWMLTFALLRLEPGAWESNPVAAACLDRYGWDGLAIYKASATLVFLTAVSLIAWRRPKVAGGVIAVSCGLLLAVTTYTHELIREVHNLQKVYGTVEVIGIPRHYTESTLPTPKSCPFPTSGTTKVASAEQPR
jgi:hypothetical protein